MKILNDHTSHKLTFAKCARLIYVFTKQNMQLFYCRISSTKFVAANKLIHTHRRLANFTHCKRNFNFLFHCTCYGGFACSKRAILFYFQLKSNDNGAHE